MRTSLFEISNNSIELIKHFESLHDGDLSMIGLQPKMDPIGIWTEGYGTAIIDPKTGKFLRGPGNKKRANELSRIKSEHAAEFELIEVCKKKAITASVKIGTTNWSQLSPDQKGALVSFVYNCGTGKPEYKIFNNIRLYLSGTWTAEQLRSYWKVSVIRAGGKILEGLVRRRNAEAHLFLTGELYFYE